MTSTCTPTPAAVYRLPAAVALALASLIAAWETDRIADLLT